MKSNKSIYSEGFAYPFFKSYFTPYTRPRMVKCLYNIFKNFFFDQHVAAFLPGKIPVKKVDHELDSKIPFKPAWGTIYLDFVFFWTRVIAFCFHRYGRKGHKQIGEFITSMGNLYAYAAEVYKKCLSTTKRPFYVARPRFFLIHLLDPHLMCIPSLHVMVVINAYIQFEQIAKHFNDELELKDQIELMRQGALAITQAILFVKQHSVNCIPAALYAMTRYAPDLFPKERAVEFVEELFSPPPVFPAGIKPPGGRIHPSCAPKINIQEADKKEIKDFIISVFIQFTEEGKTAESWEYPIVNFLRNIKTTEDIKNSK